MQFCYLKWEQAKWYEKQEANQREVEDRNKLSYKTFIIWLTSIVWRDIHSFSSRQSVNQPLMKCITMLYQWVIYICCLDGIQLLIIVWVTFLCVCIYRFPPLLSELHHRQQKLACLLLPAIIVGNLRLDHKWITYTKERWPARNCSLPYRLPLYHNN